MFLLDEMAEVIARVPSAFDGPNLASMLGGAPLSIAPHLQFAQVLRALGQAGSNGEHHRKIDGQ